MSGENEVYLCVQERKELDLLDHIVQAEVQNYSYS